MENTTDTTPSPKSTHGLGHTIIAMIVTAVVTFLISSPFEKAKTAEADLSATVKAYRERIQVLELNEVRAEERYNTLKASIDKIEATQRETLDERRKKR